MGHSEQRGKHHQRSDRTLPKITTGGTYSVLYSFCSQADCADGGVPLGTLIQGTDGYFYGTTSQGGTNGQGTIFKINGGGTLTTLHDFVCTGCSSFAYPGTLLQGTNGTFYGITADGGTVGGRRCEHFNCGTAFSLDMGLEPFVAFVNRAAKVGQQFGILGQQFIGTSSVSVNGTPANFVIRSATLLIATVPQGATTGYVAVTTPTGVLTSNVPFQVIQ